MHSCWEVVDRRPDPTINFSKGESKRVRERENEKDCVHDRAREREAGRAKRTPPPPRKLMESREYISPDF